MKYAQGTEVLVPRHHKPRGTERVWDSGHVLDVNDWNIADVELNDGRIVHCPVGILWTPEGTAFQTKETK